MEPGIIMRSERTRGRGRYARLKDFAARPSGFRASTLRLWRMWFIGSEDGGGEEMGVALGNAYAFCALLPALLRTCILKTRRAGTFCGGGSALSGKWRASNGGR